MLPDLEEDSALILFYLQKGKSPQPLFEQFGSESEYYRRREEVMEKNKVSFKFYINYEKLGLTLFIILSKFRYHSPYLIQTIPYYVVPDTNYFSRFYIPPQFEQEFLKQIYQLDPNATIYRAQEMAIPRYNFPIMTQKIPDEHKLFRWMAMFMKKKIRVFEPLDKVQFEFDELMLQIIAMILKDEQFQTEGQAQRNKIISEIGTTERKYQYREEKMDGILYQRSLNVDSIRKLLYIIDLPLKKSDYRILINSFIDMFIYCHPFIATQEFSEKKILEKQKLICLLMPPTRNIPFFHHMIDDFLINNSFVALLDNFIDNFQLHQIYDGIREKWLWKENTIQIVK